MKKLMALLLAATTAISMFATSASAVAFDDELAYTGAYIPAEVTLNGDEITVVQNYLVGDTGSYTTETNTKVITTGTDLKAFVEHIELGEPFGAPEDFSAYVAMNPGLANDTYGKIYMYDYAKDATEENDRTYEAALDKFADLVAEILSTPTKDVQYLSVEEFTTAWAKAYTTTKSTKDTPVRYDALTQARSNQRAVKNYFNADGSFKTGIFDDEDLDAYNAEALFKAVKDYSTTAATSELIYLNAEYERLVSEISYADQTSIMDIYYEKLDKVTSYVEDDFTAAGWREVQELLEEAEEIAAEAVSYYDWEDAIEVLDEAIAVRGKAVDYTELQDALAELFVGDGKATDIIRNEVYLGNDADKYIYIEEDFVVRGRVSQEWADFAGEGNGQVDGEDSAYTVAYKLWSKARSNNKEVKQSELDEALADLLDAVDALVSNADGIDEWLLVKLQSVVDAAEALNEADFNTATRKWEKFQEDIAKAVEVLEKSNPSEAEVNRAINKLAANEKTGEGSYYEMKASAKAVSSAKKDDLKELIRTADRLISNITTQTGAQVAVLREATEDADEVYATIGIDGWKKATISEVDAAIADLTAAIDNFNNPQGWYKEDGKWYYGAGAEAYAGDWYQIGETWYMFNDDASLKMSEWFQVDGKWYWANENGGLAVGWAKVDGKWYFFDQGNAMKTGWVKVDNNWYYLASSGAMVTGWNWIGGDCYYFYNNGAMAANTTIGGYTVDANGAWVK